MMLDKAPSRAGELVEAAVIYLLVAATLIAPWFMVHLIGGFTL